MSSQWDEYKQCPEVFHWWLNKSQSVVLQCKLGADPPHKRHKTNKRGTTIRWKA